MNTISSIPTKPPRRFLPDDFEVTDWSALEPYLTELCNRDLHSVSDLHRLMLDVSEIDAVLFDDQGWRYIRMTIDTADEEKSKAYDFFLSEIAPHLASFKDTINRKLMGCPFVEELDQEKYRIYLRGIRKELEIYREENVSLQIKVQQKSSEYSVISGAMEVEWEGRKLTMQQAGKFLLEKEASVREKAYKVTWNRRYQDYAKLDDLFSELLQIRHQIALNAGYENYRDYMFDSKGRFDYTKEDCFNFHKSIAAEIVPVSKMLHQDKCRRLGKDLLKPWDLDFDPEGKDPLRPFADEKELVKGTIDIFHRVHPYFGQCLATMKEMGYLDLESKAGKSPGGYNYPLLEVGVPFIFMNSVGSQRDLTTMMHEGGHAVHSFLNRDLELASFKVPPSEVAELASMSMELFTMEHWGRFYKNKEDLKRAREKQLSEVFGILLWVATVDKFQHWIYENPNHTVEERRENWLRIFSEFETGMVDYKGLEHFRNFRWQAQLHIFELPFYYIEYGIAQLGALACWRNYKQQPDKAISQYIDALKLGYTKSIGEIYKTAGISFDFSRDYVHELAAFVQTELDRSEVAPLIGI